MFVNCNDAAAKMALEFKRQQRIKEMKAKKLQASSGDFSESSSTIASSTTKKKSLVKKKKAVPADDSTSSMSSWLDDRIYTAKEHVNKAIDELKEKSAAMDAHIERATQLANARIESQNRTGAVLSLKQLKMFQAEKAHVESLIPRLVCFLDELESSTKAMPFKKRVKDIVETPMSESPSMSSDELLAEFQKMKA